MQKSFHSWNYQDLQINILVDEKTQNVEKQQEFPDKDNLLTKNCVSLP